MSPFKIRPVTLGYSSAKSASIYKPAVKASAHSSNEPKPAMLVNTLKTIPIFRIWTYAHQLLEGLLPCQVLIQSENVVAEKCDKYWSSVNTTNYWRRVLTILMSAVPISADFII